MKSMETKSFCCPSSSPRFAAVILFAALLCVVLPSVELPFVGALPFPPSLAASLMKKGHEDMCTRNGSLFMPEVQGLFEQSNTCLTRTVVSAYVFDGLSDLAGCFIKYDLLMKSSASLSKCH